MSRSVTFDVPNRRTVIVSGPVAPPVVPAMSEPITIVGRPASMFWDSPDGSVVDIVTRTGVYSDTYSDTY